MTELGAVCTCGHQWIMHASNDQCTRTTCACCQFKELPMTEQLPRAIAAEDIRVGDRVRRTQSRKDILRIFELTVDAIDVSSNEFRTAGGGRCYKGGDEDAWTLLSRPEPPRAVGSRWRDYNSGVCYVRACDGHYLPYSYRHYMRDDLFPGVPSDDRIIADLIPLDPS